MAKFKITQDNTEDRWAFVVKVANRMCYDSNKPAIVEARNRNVNNSDESD
jgi:hypothetical protein